MRSRPVYLDNHATTRTDPRVVEAMLPYFTELYGNSASVSHRFGWEAAEAVERAREQVAAGHRGRGQGDRLHLRGDRIEQPGHQGGRPRLQRGEATIWSRPPPSTRRSSTRSSGWRAKAGRSRSFPATNMDWSRPTAIADALTDRTVLVSIMAANNEVGTINPIAEIGRLCHERGVIFHTDAAQAVGKIPLDVQSDGDRSAQPVGHKIYGPKGIGALYVRRRDPQVRLEPLIDGGGHERGLRSGTVAGSAGRGPGGGRRDRGSRARRRGGPAPRASRAAASRGSPVASPAIRLNGHPADRLPGNLNLSFADVDGEALMMAMRDVAVSSGSACSSTNPEPSHVLLAMGLDEDLARASLRFGLGRFTTAEEIDFAIEAVAEAVARLRRKTCCLDDSRMAHDLTRPV